MATLHLIHNVLVTGKYTAVFKIFSNISSLGIFIKLIIILK